MYEINDNVILENIGVCQIVNIEESKEQDTKFYVLKPIDNHSSNIYIPILQAEAIKRKVITKDEMEELLERIPFIRTINAVNDKVLFNIIEEAVMKYDVLEWIKVIKTLYIRKYEKKVTESDQLYNDRIKRFFHEEVSVVLNIPYNSVEEYIKNLIANM